MGGEREIKVNVRIISATHRDLKQMVLDGGFREDLYYRLNVLTLEVPALRQRGQDILTLAEVFLEQACKQIRREPCYLSGTSRQALLAHPWPGNVRQLQNLIFRAAAICERSQIEPADLEIVEHATQELSPFGSDHETLAQSMDRHERSLLSRMYQQYPSSRRLAERLGTSHTAIAKRLRKYGISLAEG